MNAKVSQTELKVFLIISSLLATLLVLEVVSRLWVAFRWKEGDREALITVPTSWKGYIYDPFTGYRLQPDYHRIDAVGRRFTHNAMGFRGNNIAVSKPTGIVRIVLMGASTIYGPYVDDAETSAARLADWLRLHVPRISFEVINAGVPGWTSRETIINLKRHVLPLSPDILLVMDGRNEIFPQLFNNYREDYSHYRRVGFDFRQGNRVYKKIFRWSYFSMLITTGRGYRFGYSPANENPVYGFIRFDNKPDPERVVRNGRDMSRLHRFETNLETLVSLSRRQGIRLAFSSIPFFPERFGSGIFLKDTRSLPVLTEFVRRNNAAIKRVAQAHHLPYVEVQGLVRPDLLLDDCHFLPEGESALARLMGEALKPYLQELMGQRGQDGVQGSRLTSP